MDKKLEKIYKIVESKFEEVDYKYHILLVLKYAKELAKTHKADEEVVEIAALLHDIGRVDLKNDPVHHIIGSKEAEIILKELEYSQDTIDKVKHCVESHSIGKGPNPKTMEAKIIANADAMSHFDMLPVFYFWLTRRNVKFDETTKWVENKLKNDWNEKLTFPEAKKMVKEKYDAIKLLLNSLKQLK